jgi:hypothetical protein
MPSTLRRSPREAQETWAKAHDSAVKTYGEGERAHRTAFAALKHQFEKVGDHWEPKGHKGPSDPRAAMPTKRAIRGEGKTYGGVDVQGRTKEELLDLARRLGVRGRSSMTKDELATAIARANDRATERARERERQ